MNGKEGCRDQTSETDDRSSEYLKLQLQEVSYVLSTFGEENLGLADEFSVFL